MLIPSFLLNLILTSITSANFEFAKVTEIMTALRYQRSLALPN
jgi:hypothetical protein